MKSLATYAHGLARMVGLDRKQPDEPELLEDEPLPMVGLFALLSPEQQRFVLNYRGDENMGNEKFRLGKKAECRAD